MLYRPYLNQEVGNISTKNKRGRIESDIKYHNVVYP